jgi:hypothetical protein
VVQASGDPESEGPLDYSAEVRLAPQKTVRWLFLAAGHGFVGLGVLGAFLPLLPTTPFLLLAAACYARASVRFYNWLLNSRSFGPLIRDWRAHRAIRLRYKVLGAVLLVLTIGSTVVFFVPFPPAKLLVTASGLTTLRLLLTIPTRL